MKKVFVFILFAIIFNLSCSKKDKQHFKFRKDLKFVEVVTYPQVPFELDSSQIVIPISYQLNLAIFKKYKEKVNLTENQIDELEEILMQKDPKEIQYRSDCYNPRHCIYFYNKKHQLIHYFEICFECKSETASKNSGLYLFEKQRIELKDFFREIGIKEELDN